MNEEEALYLDQLNDISDIPASLEHFHREYEQAKASLSGVSADTAQVHRNLRVKLQRNIREARKCIQQGDTLVDEIKDIHKEPSQELLGKVAAIDQFSRIAKYLDWIKFLNEAVEFLNKRQAKDAWRKCIPVYDELNCYSSLMEDTACTNLKRVMVGECKKRYAILSGRALKSFGTVNWKTMTDETTPTIIENIKFLLKISEPLHHGEANISLALSYIFSNFEVQFKFHFMRKVKTNDIKKPEWYFTKLLLWIKENKEKFMNNFGNILQSECGVDNATVLYVEQFCKLAVLKLNMDVPKLDDGLFTHYIDEVLKFHKELGDVVSLSHIKSPILAVFTEDRLLKRWLQLETLTAFDFITKIWTDEKRFDARECEYHYRIPAMCSRVLTLVKSIGERVKVIPSLALNNCFYSLQCDILREFMVHLTGSLQQHSYKSEQFHLIVNTVAYVLELLEQWSYESHYVKIAKFEDDDAPFFKNMQGYTILLQDACLSLQTSISGASMSLMSPYFKQSWELPNKLDSISPASSAGLMELQQSVSLLSATLPPEQFLGIWSALADLFQQEFINKIIFKNRFNLAGAQQFKTDMQGFTGIFLDHCSPAYFSALTQHIRVLSQPTETVRLWQGEGLGNPDNLAELLQEKDISLSGEAVLAILKLRTDV